MAKFYVVKVGRNPGVYYSLEEAQQQVRGFSNADWRSFTHPVDALAYVQSTTPQKATKQIQNLQKATGTPKTLDGYVGGVQMVQPDRNPRPHVRADYERLMTTDGFQELSGNVNKALDDNQALREELAKAKAQIKAQADELAKAKTDLKAHALALANSYMIFDDLEVAKKTVCECEDGICTEPEDEEITTVYSLEQAIEVVHRNDYDKYQKKFREDLCYVDKEGEMVYLVYVDGSCKNNGTNSPAAGLGVYFGENNPMNVSEALSDDYYPHTSQRAELGAMLKAYEAIDGMHNKHKYENHTDSEYAINSIKRTRKWHMNDWLDSNGRPIKDQDLLIELMAVRDDAIFFGNEIILKKVKGHGNSKGNIMADKFARKAAEDNHRLMFGPWYFQPGYSVIYEARHVTTQANRGRNMPLHALRLKK
ncbi:Ribonuclease H [Yarrowia sp. B02]|nr:Ribonuclease H [Yarrowia sp. B02]